MDSIIQTDLLRISLGTAVQHSLDFVRQRVTDGKPGTPECHTARQFDILQMGFRIATDIVHLGMVVLL